MEFAVLLYETRQLLFKIFFVLSEEGKVEMFFAFAIVTYKSFRSCSTCFSSLLSQCGNSSSVAPATKTAASSGPLAW